MTGKPAENSSFSVGVVVAATLLILRAYHVNIPDGVDAAVVILVGFVAHVVTGWINRRQKNDPFHPVDTVGASH